MPTATDYRLPRPGRKYIDATERADQAAREAQRRRASQHTDEIRAAQRLKCPAAARFNHIINNDLYCARCDQTTDQILGRTRP